ncbi:hypothetical protein FCR2A7T_28610 [Flavobacterium cauense R2A-7]|nr:hypothetical protein FCR2A7T_28610 [Flavobacterium cauense R2A-7]
MNQLFYRQLTKSGKIVVKNNNLRMSGKIFPNIQILSWICI